MNVYSK